MKLVRESILKGPSEEEIYSKLENLKPNEVLIKSIEHGFLKGVKKALERGANIHAYVDYALRYASEYGQFRGC